jgi:hypothetical protein
VHLDQNTLESLTLSMEYTLAMQPGESHAFSLGVVECCYFFEPLDACATWSVVPTAGASIDSQTGVLTVDATTPSGSVFRVSADVEDGRRVVSIEVHIFTPDANPLVGTWTEEAQFTCGTGEEVVPDEAIGELRFWADGRFAVTWFPFEVYYDYWGTYTYDLADGTIDLVVTGGNYVPDYVDGGGLFSFDEQGRLILSDIWLGSSHGETGPANCGHRFS